MATSKVMHGGRAKIYVGNDLIGIFESISYSLSFGTEAIHILGRHGPAEIITTSVEAASLNCSGFRVIDDGGMVKPRVPKLSQLLALEGITIHVTDRVDPSKTVLLVTGCAVSSYSGGYNAKATSRISISYVGLVLTEENSVGDAEVNPAEFS